jgi:hypothetical protein
MDDRLCFIQFLHPGGEHEPNNKRLKTWNTGAHRRKFLKSRGRYLAGNDPRDDEIVFWGEWEPESRVIEEVEEPLPDGPRWVYEPYYVSPASYRRLQNTDPFVFGERFLYTGCMQHRQGRPTQLRHLARGSVILFGSCLHKSCFVVDTLFVVADHIDHTKRDYRDGLRDHVSETYAAVTLAPWYGNMIERDKSHRLYYGATFEAPVEDMFSFFPCLPYAEYARGFARPTIHIPDVITDTQCMGFKKNEQAGISAVKDLWNEVVGQITDQGLMLGIDAALPLATSTVPTNTANLIGDVADPALCAPGTKRPAREDASCDGSRPTTRADGLWEVR